MNDQYRRDDPDTSREAAESHATKAASNRETIHAYVRTFPNKTAGEIADGTKLDRVEVGRRLPELRASFLLANGPARKCTVLGTNQLTWLPANRRAVKQEAVSQGVLF